MHRVLTHLLTSSPVPARTETVDHWWASHLSLGERWREPVDLALAMGHAADRPAWAFASGYRAALGALVPDLDRRARAALAVTEDTGNAPSAIATSVHEDGGALVLRGTKAYVTLGPHADDLFVLAREGETAEGRPNLALIRVPRASEGLALEVLAPPPFVPEVPHARAVLDRVRVPLAARQPGDGWADYVKPFRTVEDAHVHAALLGYFVAVGRRNTWPSHAIEKLTALVAAARAVCLADSRSASTHLALAGVLAETRRLAVDAELWDRVDTETRAMWSRDRALLAVAEKARAARLERAWQTLGE